ncbi:MAG: decaprenyl-phosphate phosphoribosyltransferase [Calditrichaeota bacterium]|nr:MAG: decaprenyl-phosphate phosphoribosyltransferase [Calditrichota bacterium]
MESMTDITREVPTARSRLHESLRLMRWQQWHKNAFVLIGFLALGEYSDFALLARALINTLSFCLVSSAVYIFNDFWDREEDRKHPLKRHRPLAAGTVPLHHAFILGAILLVASFGLSMANGKFSVLILATYVANSVVYTLYFKELPILDVFLIAFGFMLRIFSGTLGIGIYVSEWLIITGFMVSLLIGFAKRYAELANHFEAQNHRGVLKNYSLETIKTFVIIMSSATIVTYALYTVSPRPMALHNTHRLIYTTPFVIFGIFRFLHLMFMNQTGEDPANLVITDKYLLFTIFGWLLTYGLMIGTA